MTMVLFQALGGIFVVLVGIFESVSVNMPELYRWIYRCGYAVSAILTIYHMIRDEE